MDDKRLISTFQYATIYKGITEIDEVLPTVCYPRERLKRSETRTEDHSRDDKTPIPAILPRPLPSCLKHLVE